MTRRTATTPPADKPARTSRTPRERAERALESADRQVAKLTKRRDYLKAEHDTAEADLQEVTRRRDYLAQDPALPPAVTEDDPTPVDVPEGYAQ